MIVPKYSGGFVMIKSRIIWIICLIGTFAFLFFSDENIALVFFAVTAVVPMLLIIINQFSIGNVLINVEMPQASEKNKQIIGQIRVVNGKKNYLSLVKCKLNCKNLVTGEEVTEELLFPLSKKKDECMASFILESKFCGCIVTNINFLKVYDVFGLFGVKLKAPLAVETIVLPDTFSPQLSISAHLVKDVEADEYAQTKAGNDPSETFSIREYHPGDNLGRIHWKLTEKFDQILIREAGLPIRHSFLILLETSILSETMQDAKIDDALLEITMSLCQKMTEKEIVYEIGWQDYYTKSFFRCRISNLDELSGMMNKLMHTHYQQSDLDAMSYFSENCSETNFEHILYISRFFWEKFEQFDLESHVTAVICTSDMNIAETTETKNLNLYFCTPENYEVELFALAI